MSMTKEELVLQITLKSLENGLIERIASPDVSIGEINSQTAYSVAEFYNNILGTIKAYKHD